MGGVEQIHPDMSGTDSVCIVWHRFRMGGVEQIHPDLRGTDSEGVGTLRMKCVLDLSPRCVIQI